MMHNINKYIICKTDEKGLDIALLDHVHCNDSIGEEYWVEFDVRSTEVEEPCYLIESGEYDRPTFLLF